MTNAVLKKGNVFLNTSPEEVNAFHDFLSQHTTFDVIIDGLNVAHQTRQKASTSERDYIVSITDTVLCMCLCNSYTIVITNLYSASLKILSEMFLT